MSQLTKKICTFYNSKKPVLYQLQNICKRLYATEADPEDYGYFPDPLEQAHGIEKKMLLAKLAGDDRYEPKVYYRAPHTTADYPNLVPIRGTNRMVGCLGEPDDAHMNYWRIRKGALKRCECGHWFKGIQGDLDSF